MSETIGRRYARALVLALGEGDANAEALTRVENELSALAALMSSKAGEGNAEFRHAMLNPSFSAKDRAAILDSVVTEHKFHDVTQRFVALLVEKERVPSLPSIANAFRNEVDERLGRVRATITSARPLDDSTLNTMVKALEKKTGKTVVPETVVDARVISGVSARIGGTVYDRTLRAQLDRLASSLVSA